MRSFKLYNVLELFCRHKRMAVVLAPVPFINVSVINRLAGSSNLMHGILIVYKGTAGERLPFSQHVFPPGWVPGQCEGGTAINHPGKSSAMPLGMTGHGRHPGVIWITDRPGDPGRRWNSILFPICPAVPAGQSGPWCSGDWSVG